jgi:hypothetical protein
MEILALEMFHTSDTIARSFRISTITTYYPDVSEATP